MNCEEARASLSFYVAGDIERHGAREALGAHLGACDSCRALAEEWEASHRLLQLHQPPEFGDAFFDSVRRDVMRQISEPRPSLLARLLGQPFGPRTLTYATALSLLVCAVLLSTHFLRRAPSPVVEVTKQRHVGPVKEEASVAQDTGARTQQGATANVNKIIVGAPTTQPNQARQRGVAQAHVALKRNARRVEKLPTQPQTRDKEQVATSPRVPGVVPPGVEPQTAGASNQVETVAAAEREMLRIELQTADPNVRIIWLSPRTTDSASSGRTNR